MKKSYIFIGIFLIFIIVITVIGSIIVTGNVKVTEDKDILTIQSNKEVYFKPYGYSIDNPNIIVNPYGNSPLTAIAMFETSNYSEVSIKILSKDGNSDIFYTFAKDKYHLIPIYGLYADYDNTIILSSEGKEKVINIKTDSLPEDFTYVDNGTSGNFMFYNSNYPYAIDNNGEVRWYLNSNYYGNISLMDNSTIIIGSNRYNEEGRTISFYEINLLGKIYNEYIMNNDYYGYNTIIEGNAVVLSNKVMLIDLQTGEVKREYFNNDGYDYVDNVDGDIVVRKDNIYYKFTDNELKETSYDNVNKEYSFYNNTVNYSIIPSSRYGSLLETKKSDKRISLINYDKNDDLNILLKKEIDRILVTNNNEDNIYIILDKFLDKRVYEVSDTLYINDTSLSGKYTVYVKIKDRLYKTDYYIEV
ncbi:MAG: aryl-sulfate sulfotransferase [Bacilli bacterium]